MTEPLHVAVAAHDFYPDSGSGGTGRYVYETTRRMVDRGHRVSVLTRRRGDDPARESIEGVDVYRYDVSIVDETAPTILSQLPAAALAVRSHAKTLSRPDSPDVVSFQGPVTSLLADAALPQAPRITTFHSPWSTEYAIKRRRDGEASTGRRRINVALRRWIERAVLRRSDAALTLSAYMRGRLREIHGDGIDVSVVPGGVDVDRFSPDAGDFDRIDADGVAFLTVRRLSERMGHGHLLAAFGSIGESFPDSHLYVAGDGPLRERLEREADRRGIGERTTFLGYVPDAELPSAYATSDVFVLPTQSLEGFGLATLEALASGTPVVATPVGGTIEILDGLDDRLPATALTDDASTTALADAMASWARLDPTEHARAGERCRDYVAARYTWDETVDELLETYLRHLDRRSERRMASRS